MVGGANSTSTGYAFGFTTPPPPWPAGKARRSPSSRCIQHRTIGSGQRTANRDLNYAGYRNANTLALLPLLMGELTAATLDLKLNLNVASGFERSICATRLADGLTLYEIAGKPSNERQDHRAEFAPIFTFWRGAEMAGMRGRRRDNVRPHKILKRMKAVAEVACREDNVSRKSGPVGGRTRRAA